MIIGLRLSSLIHPRQSVLLNPVIPSSKFILRLMPNHFVFSFEMQINSKYTIILACSSDGFGELVVAGLLRVEKLFWKD